MAERKRESMNLIDENQILSGKSINQTNGELIDSTATNLTDFIVVKKGIYYTIKATANGELFSSNSRPVGLYDSNDAYVGTTALLMITPQQMIDGTTFVIPDTLEKEVYKIRIAIDKAMTNIMLNEGSTAIPYEPYGTIWESCAQKRYTASKPIERTGTLPITLNANGDALLDYRIYGNTEQTGTPTPENPIIPIGCGVRTENLIRNANTTRTAGGGVVIDQIAGKSEIIIVSRIATAADISVTLDVLAELSAGAYTLSVEGIIDHGVRGVDRVYIRDNNDNIIVNSVQTGKPRQFTISEDTKITKLTLVFAAESEYNNQVVRVMLTEGSTAPASYIPYGYKLPMVSRGENLFDEDYDNISTTIRYRPIYVGIGYFTLSTTTPLGIDITYGTNIANVFLLSGNVTSGASTQGNGAWLNHSVTAQSVDGYVTVAYRHYSSTISPAECETMLNAGSTARPYEPYNFTVSNIYLGESQTTRRIKKLVLTGEETITFSSEDDNRIVGHFTIPDMEMMYTFRGYCNILIWKASYSQSEYNRIVAYTPQNFYVSLAKAILPEPTFDSFKAYIAAQYAAGTPVTIWYVLAEPETAVVNEPLMKIGDYTDTVSMEQAGVSIPTINGSTVIDYDGTTKPSQMYVKYNSWSGWSDINNYKMVNEDWTQEMT